MVPWSVGFARWSISVRPGPANRAPALQVEGAPCNSRVLPLPTTVRPLAWRPWKIGLYETKLMSTVPGPFGMTNVPRLLNLDGFWQQARPFIEAPGLAWNVPLLLMM